MPAKQSTPNPETAPNSTPGRALAGILEGSAVGIEGRRAYLNPQQMSPEDIAAIRHGIAALDAELWALKRMFR
ncbi:hypothetical protein P5V63_03270 [Mycobacteroides abscessus subsp. abscessus]|uniref:Uncharacterized protein n=1 Tax=Mycobacteroides abscessus 21 TaxID=1299324 RepID=A0A829Q126_9MYCO|nr:hypothetical protein [Mycobacteroides abscessus]EUA46363.1 hypothetical protein I543_1143 [Mycobacteroides abscessus 21]MBE5494397.1 hypothetical protein [Mycobacteroides abscessus]MDO3092020.1 hypothetical protein [Mycobacteroides abscessus subsp. abscessus]SHP48759.1 Uncharacterised protein [Mycobacteroides abscessus subsp. abscessus]SHP48883.1 Uncharacterised protein [Mycobacteroides abscessus subsp. abscessus]